MKYSNIFLGSLLTISALSLGCNKYDGISPTGPSTSPNPVSSTATGSGSTIGVIATPGPGLGIISTPKPVSGLDEVSPQEPTPYVSAAPFILGKPGTSFNGGIRPSDEPTGPVVPGKMSGIVYGYELNSKTYKVLSNAKVLVNGSLITTDSSGAYKGTEVLNSESEISASAPGYYSSTVSAVRPGDNRDIHLQPLDNRPVYNQNTISFDILSLAGVEPTNISSITAVEDTTTTKADEETTLTDPKYPSLLSFGDKNNSRFITKVIDQEKGRIRVEINPIASQSTSTGQLFVYDIERDNSGRPTNPTQMKKFIYKKDVTFRVGDTYFPGTAPAADGTVADTATTNDETFDLLTNFANINVKFSDSYGFNNFVCNAYAVFPTGEKVLVSRYSGASPTSLSFRVPKIAGVNLSYSVEAHAGNANIGSDVVINDLRADASVEAYLLQPPSALTPSHDTENAGVAPLFSWSATQDAKAFQVEVKDTNLLNESGWEGFTDKTSLRYPSGLTQLKSGAQYNYQVLAMDFNFGGFRVLSNKAEDMRLRAVKQKTGDLPFKVQLASHASQTLPMGYRVSYNTVLFRAK